MADAQGVGTNVSGEAASDLPVVGNPVLIGGRASSAIPTAVSGDGDAVSQWLDRSGGTIINGRDAHDVALDANTNPVLMGARAQDTAPTAVSTAGDAVRLWASRVGTLGVMLADSFGNLVQVSSPVDSTSAADITSASTARLLGYNGSSFDRLRTSTPLEGTGDTTPITGLLAAGAGPGFDRRDNPANLGATIGNTSTFDINGSQMVRIGVNTATTGTFTIEATTDNVTFVACEAYDATADLRVTGASLTPTVGKVYIVTTAGYRQLRLRTVSTFGATMAHSFTGSLGNANNEVKTVPYLAPVALLQGSARYTTTQTSTNLVTGTAGQRIYLSQMSIATGSTVAVRVSVYYGTGAFSSGTSPTVFDGEFAPSATIRPGAVLNFPIPTGGSSATGDNLRVTTDAAATVYVNAHYYKA